MTGIARVNVYGAALTEMEIRVAPERLARYRLTVTEVLRVLREANSSVSAGDVNEGKRRYVVRTVGEFERLDDVRGVVLRSERDPATGASVVFSGDTFYHKGLPLFAKDCDVLVHEAAAAPDACEVPPLPTAAPAPRPAAARNLQSTT